jgi:hypothetical protein
MLKKYLPFLVLGPISNALWAFWALPEINEQGTFAEMFQWICVQALLPVMLGILLLTKWRLVFWLFVIHSGFIILYAIGILGWALMGLATPVSIYVVAVVLLVMGFGILYHALKDLKFDQKWVKYETID